MGSVRADRNATRSKVRYSIAASTFIAVLWISVVKVTRASLEFKAV